MRVNIYSSLLCSLYLEESSGYYKLIITPSEKPTNIIKINVTKHDLYTPLSFQDLISDKVDKGIFENTLIAKNVWGTLLSLNIDDKGIQEDISLWVDYLE